MFTTVPRLELQEILEGLLGSPNVYFQPPANIAVLYPCIVYSRDTARTSFGDNLPYRYTKRYQVTVIDRNPDSLTPDKVAKLPTCIHLRHFTTSHLHHDVFLLNY